MSEVLTLSPLPKTWIFDVDGTLVIHNGHLQAGGDKLLPGVAELFGKIPETDKIILLTARKDEYRERLVEFLKLQGLRFDVLLTGIPQGERILINDKKPSGLLTAYAVNKGRDTPLDIDLRIDPDL